MFDLSRGVAVFILLLMVLTAPALTHAQQRTRPAAKPATPEPSDSSELNQGDIVLRVNPFFLAVGGIWAGAEYYVTNTISAGADVIKWSDDGYDFTGLAPFGRYHFLHAKSLFGGTFLSKGDFYGYGGLLGLNWDHKGSRDSATVGFLGVGYMLVISKHWVLEANLGVAADTSGGGKPTVGFGPVTGYAW